MKFSSFFSDRYLSNFFVAFEAVMANKLRSLLTALGIIFGVAAVIAMLAIGNGAQQEILEQIRLVGVNNIVISPIVPQTEENLSDESTKDENEKFSPGLTLKDIEGIKEISSKSSENLARITIESEEKVDINLLTQR